MSTSQPSIPQGLPLSPPPTPRGTIRPLPGMETAPLQPPTPLYSLCPMKERHVRGSQAGPSTESINNVLIHMFQEAPNSYWEAMNSPDKDKWLQASKEEFEGLAEMGAWKLVDHPDDCKTIKCRWTYVLKSDGCYKARLVAKGYTQVQGIDYCPFLYGFNSKFSVTSCHSTYLSNQWSRLCDRSKF